MNPDIIGRYEERELPFFRNATLDTLMWGEKKHHIPLMMEIDVTVAREAIRAQKEQSGQGISFTGWIVKCLAQAISEHKHIHALRKGKKRLVIFEDVDIVIVMERAVRGEVAGNTIPMPYLLRKANEKTLLEIHSEIRAAQTTPVDEGEVQIGSSRPAWLTKFYFTLPRFIRNLFFWSPLFKDPFRIKCTMGTVSVSAVGMIAHAGISWGIPIGIHPLVVGVGGIAQRPILINGQFVPREYLGLTVLFDHEVTDGAPVARFIERLQELMENGYGLVEPKEGQT